MPVPHACLTACFQEDSGNQGRMPLLPQMEQYVTASRKARTWKWELFRHFASCLKSGTRTLANSCACSHSSKCSDECCAVSLQGCLS